MKKPKNEYVNKPVMFKRTDPEDMELYEWLQRRLKIGEFTQDTKAFWRNKMKEEQK